MSFFGELKRRNVFRASAAYAVVAWLLIQVADTLLPVYGAPEWVMPVFTTLLVLGLPVTAIIAWAFELTPEGIRTTAAADRLADISSDPSAGDSPLSGKKLNYAIAALLVVAVAYMVMTNLRTDAPAETTIAILPFTNVSGDTGQDAFTDGFVVELHNSLAQIDDLRVTALTSSMTFRDSALDAREIGAQLGVDYLLEGRVTRSDESLRVFATLIRAADGTSVWSNPYDRELSDPLALQLELAEAVAERLSVTFGVGDFERTAGGTTNLEAYDFYLAARGAALQADLPRATALFDRAIALDPDFGLAHLHLFEMLFFRLRLIDVSLDYDVIAGGFTEDALGTQQIIGDQVRAREALARARELVPEHSLFDLFDAIEHVDAKRWAEAETAFRDRLNSTTRSDALGNREIATFLYQMGRAREAIPFLEEARRLDPKSAHPVGLLAMVYDALGDFDSAVALDAEARALDGYRLTWQFPQYWRLRAIGDDDAADQVLVEYDANGAMASMQRLYRNPSDIAASATALMTANVGMLAAADGNVELALEMWRRAVDTSPLHLAFVWTPLLRDVRRHPDFEMLMSDLGLPGYWRRYGWPEHCRPAEPEGFECD